MESLLDPAALPSRVLVGAILVLAGAGKIRAGRSNFLKAISAFEILPSGVASAVARVLPIFELACGSMLLAGLWTQVAAQAAFALITVLSAAMVHALAHGRRVFCRCFGFTGEEVADTQWRMVGRNLVLLLACACAAFGHDAWRLDRALASTAVAPSATTAAVMTVCFLLVAALAALVRLGWTYEVTPTARNF